MTATMTPEGIPLGDQYIAKGPGPYAFLIEGLHRLAESDGRQNFEIAGVNVPIKITGARQVPYWKCPSLPPHLRSASYPERDWSYAWEFDGYVPGEAVPVRGVYSTFSRKGVVHLWQAHVDDYGCQGARRDLALYFRSESPFEAEMALERAMVHMANGSVFQREGPNLCKTCWDLYHTLRRSCVLTSL